MKSMLDRRTDLLKATILRMRGHVHETFKKTDPYRMVKMSDDDILAQYSQLDPMVAEQLRQTVPENMARLEKKVSDITRRRYA